jgi:hypothetical protein
LNAEKKSRPMRIARRTSQIHEPGITGAGRRRGLPLGGGDERGGMKNPRLYCLGLCSFGADLTGVGDRV